MWDLFGSLSDVCVLLCTLFVGVDEYDLGIIVL